MIVKQVRYYKTNPGGNLIPLTDYGYYSLDNSGNQKRIFLRGIREQEKQNEKESKAVYDIKDFANVSQLLYQYTNTSDAELFEKRIQDVKNTSIEIRNVGYKSNIYYLLVEAPYSVNLYLVMGLYRLKNS